MKLFIYVCAVCFALPVAADVRVDFIEGAPKDRFVITNIGECAVNEALITIDMANSAGRNVFDVTGKGAGVEVFQPLDIVSGGDVLTTIPAVQDGDTAITLSVRTLITTGEVAFTIDVDDTGGGREITVSGAEMAGAVARVATGDVASTGVFDAGAGAIVQMPDCAS